jgi:hypothetical protein
VDRVRRSDRGLAHIVGVGQLKTLDLVASGYGGCENVKRKKKMAAQSDDPKLNAVQQSADQTRAPAVAAEATVAAAMVSH